MKSSGLLVAAVAVALVAATPAAPVQARPDATMAQVAMMSAGARAAQIRKIRTVPSIGVIRLDLTYVPTKYNEHEEDRAFFNRMASRHAGDIQKLRSALRANPVTRSALAKRGIPINRIVGVQIGSNGSLRLYFL